MKSKLIVGVILAVAILVIVMGAIMMSDNAQLREQELSQSSLATDSREHCGKKYMIVGNDLCVLNHEFIEPHTIVIYDVAENGGTRLIITPHTLVMNLTDGNTLRFVNDGSTTVNIFDKSKRIWGFDNVNPLSQRILTINNTGYYEVLVQNSREGESGRIVVLDENMDSLSVGNRIKMGKAIISGNFQEYPEIVSVGGGSAEIGVHVTINEKELKLHADAKSYYHEKYSKIIPFDVPIVIEFSEPIRME